MISSSQKFLNVMVTFCITLKSYHMICESVAELAAENKKAIFSCTKYNPSFILKT